MKTTIMLLFLCVTINAQTEEAEKAYLQTLIAQVSGPGGLSSTDQKELRIKGLAWSQLLKDFGGYPKLPYNEKTNQIELSYILDLNGISEDIIYSRVKEWVAIVYGSIASVLHYDDPKRGKLIVKGDWPLLVRKKAISFWAKEETEVIGSVNCSTTTIFTIKEGRLKVDFTNIIYRSETIDLTTRSIVETKNYITELYPVTAGEEDTWKSRLSTLEETEKALGLSSQSLDGYIKAYQSDMDF